MAWTAPTPRTTGELITASIWNIDLTDNLNALRAGGLALGSQAGGDFIYAATPTQLGRVGSGDNTSALFGGNPPVVRKAVGKHSIWLPAPAFHPDIGEPCGPLTNIGQLYWAILGYPFSSSTQQIANHPGIVLPKAWDRGSLSVQVYWTHAGGGSGGVAWAFWAVQAYGHNDDFTDISQYSGVFLYGTALPAKYLHITPAGTCTLNGSPQSGDVVRFSIFREPSDANDTLAEDAYFLGVSIVYNTNVMTDD
jgi:hypothetical protein